MKTFTAILVFFFFFTFFTVVLGCSVKQTNELDQNAPLQDTTPVGDTQKNSKADFIPGFHPFKDDPDNPSPHNPLVKKFGDIPEVRTYIRLNQKFRYGIGLTVDEAIAFYTAEAYLYPSPKAKATLKAWKKDKERYQRLGLPMDGLVMRYNVNPDTSDAPVDTENDE